MTDKPSPTCEPPAGLPHAHDSAGPRLVLPARPQPLALQPGNSAVIVVDMQNAYASPGGYVDQAGFDIAGAQAVTARIARVAAAARSAGMLVVFLQNGWDSGYAEAGGPGSPNWHKSNALKTMRARPELQGRFLAKGGWDYAMVDALQPGAQDLVIPKSRYSGFYNSALDSSLRARGIRNLIFTGIATNVCVEATLRDAFHLEYFCALLEDATHPLGGSAMQAATLYNVETFFGWVARVGDFCSALADARPATTTNTDLQHA